MGEQRAADVSGFSVVEEKAQRELNRRSDTQYKSPGSGFTAGRSNTMALTFFFSILFLFFTTAAYNLWPFTPFSSSSRKLHGNRYMSALTVGGDGSQSRQFGFLVRVSACARAWEKKQKKPTKPDLPKETDEMRTSAAQNKHGQTVLLDIPTSIPIGQTQTGGRGGGLRQRQ